MEVSYKKDIRNNYLVIPGEDGENKDDYCIQMLKANDIPGIIRPDIRIIDNRVLYYYDISSKQSMEILFEKASINYEKLKSIFISLTKVIDQTYEYLLSENDIILNPEYIYMDPDSDNINICYLPGYNSDLKKQLILFLEYIMNKVEYKDHDAVLYIYNLYSLCRSDSFSYDKFLSYIREEIPDRPVKPVIRKNKIPEKNEDKQKEEKEEDIIKTNINPERQIPLMQEKISDDKEKYYYPVKTYVYTVICILGALFILIISIKTGLVYTSMGSRIDFGRVTVLLLIVSVGSGYVLKRIWDRKNRMTKVVREIKYVDPPAYETDTDENIFYKGFKFAKNTRETDHNTADEISGNRINDVNEEKSNEKPCENKLYGYELYNNKLSGSKLYKSGNPLDISDSIAERTGEDIKPTVLLKDYLSSFGCRLEPEEKDTYEVIQITDFPFIIGKQKGKVDYFLNSEVVSRYHVKIIKEENNYYIMDLNSTNGTCLNQNPLSCYQRYELKNGDEVDIAGIKYKFYKNEL